MGQNFTIVNVDRNEMVAVGRKVYEVLHNQTALQILAYLLFEGPQDGSMLCNHADPDIFDNDAEQMREMLEEVGSPLADTYYDMVNESVSKEARKTAFKRAAQSYESHRLIAEANDYAGRWAGDDVRIVGQYDKSGLYDETMTQIAEDTIDEMNDHGLLDRDAEDMALQLDFHK